METQEITVEKLIELIDEKDRMITELKQQIQWFMEQIRLVKHKQIGISCEQTNTLPMNLINETGAACDKCFLRNKNQFGYISHMKSGGYYGITV